MADERQSTDEELLLTDAVEGDEQDGDEPERTEDDNNPDDKEDAGEEEILSFGDDLADEKPNDSDLIKHLRNELKEARKKAAAQPAETAKPIEVGEKPTLAGCDYDEEKFEAELDDWKQRKSAAERQTTDATEQQRKAAEAWDAEKKRYTAGKATLGYADADDAEDMVSAGLGENLMGALIMATDQPARVVYALSKHPDRLTELAGLASNPIKFIAGVAKLEGQLKVIKRKKGAEPEKIETGSGSLRKGSDRQLEKLEKKAVETGDRTELIAYRKRLKEGRK